jgi:hypothetical protein
MLASNCREILPTLSIFKDGSLGTTQTGNANNLGCLIMPVVQGHERKNYQIIDAVNRLRHALVESDCDLFASIINGVEASQVEELRKRYSHQPDSTFPVCVVPSEPSLNMLSVIITHIIRPQAQNIVTFAKNQGNGAIAK